MAYRVTARLTLIANRLFRQHGLDVYSSRILLLLLDVDDRAVGELVEAMALPQSTISHQLLRLERLGLVTKRRVPQDNRVVRVRLTEAGLRAGVAVQAFSRRVNRAILDDLDPIERLVLPDAMRKVLKTLEREGA